MISIQKYKPPYNYRTKFPNVIIYKSPITTKYGIMTCYNMSDTKTCQFVGQMIAHPVQENMFSGFYPTMTGYESLKIEALNIYEQRQGYGSKFLKFAQKESFKLGCNGKVHLIASRIYDPQNPPHIFYRKRNFTSIHEDKIKYIDNCIKKNIPMDISMADNLSMYLPLTHKQHLPKIHVLYRYIRKLLRF